MEFSGETAVGNDDEANRLDATVNIACDTKYYIDIITCDTKYYIDIITCDTKYYIDIITCDTKYYIDITVKKPASKTYVIQRHTDTEIQT